MKNTNMQNSDMDMSGFTVWEDNGGNMFNRVKESGNTGEELLAEIVQQCNIDFEQYYVVGLCTGMIPEHTEALSRISYREYNERYLAMCNHIANLFETQKIGYEVYRSVHKIHLLGVIRRDEDPDYFYQLLQSLMDQIEIRFGVKLCIGVGMTAYEQAQIHNSYMTAQYAFDLYFFDRVQLIEFEKIHRDFTRSPDEYDTYLEEAFHAVLVKDPAAMERIDAAMHAIGEIHYGNWQAVLMRTMSFTGDMGSRLKRYRMLQSDFYAMQDALQVKVLNARTLAEVKEVVHDHFQQLLPELYKNDRSNSKIMIEQVKSYIQENFMEQLSIEELAEVACVSPNYFSHLFKNETGVNYKTYHTKIRMKKALELLTESDYKLYEICEKIGYNNVRTFVDAFKKEYSVSPMKYKQSMKKE